MSDREMLKLILSKVTNVESDVAVLKEDVAELKADVAVLKEDVAVLKEDVAVLKEDVAKLKYDMANVQADVSNLQTSMSTLTNTVNRNYELTLEFYGKQQEVNTLFLDKFDMFAARSAMIENQVLKNTAQLAYLT